MSSFDVLSLSFTKMLRRGNLRLGGRCVIFVILSHLQSVFKLGVGERDLKTPERSTRSELESIGCVCLCIPRCSRIAFAFNVTQKRYDGVASPAFLIRLKFPLWSRSSAETRLVRYTKHNFHITTI